MTITIELPEEAGMEPIPIYELFFKKPLASYQSLREVVTSMDSLSNIGVIPLTYYLVRIARDDGNFEHIILITDENEDFGTISMLTTTFMDGEFDEFENHRFVIIHDINKKFTELMKTAYEKAKNFMTSDTLPLREEKGGKLRIPESGADMIVKKSGIYPTDIVFRYLYEKFGLFEIVFRVHDKMILIPNNNIITKFKVYIDRGRLITPVIKLTIGRVTSMPFELLDEFVDVYRDKILKFEMSLRNNIEDKLAELSESIGLSNDEKSSILDVFRANKLNIEIVSNVNSDGIRMNLLGKEYTPSDIPSDFIITSIIYKYYNALFWAIVENMNDIISENITVEDIIDEVAKQHISVDYDDISEMTNIGLHTDKLPGLEIKVGKGGEKNE